MPLPGYSATKPGTRTAAVLAGQFLGFTIL